MLEPPSKPPFGTPLTTSLQMLPRPYSSPPLQPYRGDGVTGDLCWPVPASQSGYAGRASRRRKVMASMGERWDADSSFNQPRVLLRISAVEAEYNGIDAAVIKARLLPSA